MNLNWSISFAILSFVLQDAQSLNLTEIPENSNVTLTCFDTELYPFNTLQNATDATGMLHRLAWLLSESIGHQNRTVTPGWVDENGHCRVSQDGRTFEITRIKPEYYGLYFCAVWAPFGNETNTKYVWYYLSHGVNIYGPKVADIRQKYLHQGVYGGAAAATLFCGFLIFWFVSANRYEVRKADDNGNNTPIPVQHTDGYGAVGLINTGTPVADSVVVTQL